MNRMRLTGFAAIVALAGACTTPAPVTRYYTFEPAAPDAQVLSAPALGNLAIGPVRVPPYLDQAAIVTREGQAVVPHEFERWASPVGDAIQETLIDRVGQRLPEVAVAAFPGSPGFAFERRIAVEIVRLDGALGGDARIGARWRIIDAATAKALKEYRYDDTVAIDGGRPRDLVAALGELLVRLADRMAEAIATGP